MENGKSEPKAQATAKGGPPRLVLRVPRVLIPGGKEHAAGTTIAEIRILNNVKPSAVDKAILAGALTVEL